MRSTLALVCLLLAGAAPTPQPAERAARLMKKGKLKDAIPLLQEALGEPGADKTSLHVALAKCYFYTDNRVRAELEIEVAVELTTALELDPTTTAPDFLAFFRDHVHRPSAATSAPSSAPASIPASIPLAEERPVDAPRVLAPVVDEYRPADLAVRWLPFGIGQFLNDDPAAGATFLSLEITLVAANIAFSVVNARARGPDGLFPAGKEWPALYALQQVTAAAAIITGVLSIIDALAWSPARARASRTGSTAAHRSVGPRP